MARLKGELQADNGDVLYPHKSSDVVFTSDGKTVTKELEYIKNTTEKQMYLNDLTALRKELEKDFK